MIRFHPRVCLVSEILLSKVESTLKSRKDFQTCRARKSNPYHLKPKELFMETSSQNDSFAVFWIKTGKKIYKLTFLGTCARVTLKGGFIDGAQPFTIPSLCSVLSKKLKAQGRL